MNACSSRSEQQQHKIPTSDMCKAGHAAVVLPFSFGRKENGSKERKKRKNRNNKLISIIVLVFDLRSALLRQSKEQEGEKIMTVLALAVRTAL